MKLLNYSLKIFILITVFSLGVLFSAYFYRLFGFSIQKDAVLQITTVASSLLGGMISGLIAFIIARSQINNEDKLKKESKQQERINNLNLIKFEINHNKSIYESGNKTIFHTNMENDVWGKLRFSFVEILEPKVFLAISNFYRDIADIQTKGDSVSIKSEEIDVRVKLAEKLIKRLERLLKEENKKFYKPNDPLEEGLDT